MKKNLRNFLVELIQHYSDQEEINYICYDGTAEPNAVEHDPHFIMKSKDALGYTEQWITDYIENKKPVYYYELFKALIKEISGLWVNPTFEELKTFDEKNNHKNSPFLKKDLSFDQNWVKNAKKNLADQIDKQGYSLIQGKELIERLVQAYDSYNSKDKAFIEWVAPVDISLIENEADYILDREVYLKPLRVTNNLLLEYDNQKLKVDSLGLPFYFEHVVATKRGLDSQKIVEDKQMDFYFYQDVMDYLEDNEYETVETAYQKLFTNSVNPSQPFVEVVIDHFTEAYINIRKLETENDLLAFINHAYTVEGSDLEAKSFNRKEIIKKMSSETFENVSMTDYLAQNSPNNK